MTIEQVERRTVAVESTTALAVPSLELQEHWSVIEVTALVDTEVAEEPLSPELRMVNAAVEGSTAQADHIVG